MQPNDQHQSVDFANLPKNLEYSIIINKKNEDIETQESSNINQEELRNQSYMCFF